MESIITSTGVIEDWDGPVQAWENPDGYWTPELSAAVDECRAGTRSAIPCPVCGEDTFSVSMDTIYRESHVPGRPVSWAGVVGSVATLHPCGHTLKR
ncbi:hypothetical protein [Streptomyces virginiae]|uniref:hypothetical protein n=1 Tax=Streptomyces virginiae TaxID=1961 RepID=UPI0036B0ACBE